MYLYIYIYFKCHIQLLNNKLMVVAICSTIGNSQFKKLFAVLVGIA